MVINFADKITKVPRILSHNRLETATNESKTIEHDRETPKETCISPEKRQKTIDDLKLIQ